jgi:hypothetical protein
MVNSRTSAPPQGHRAQSSKLDYLRQQALAYLQDSTVAQNDREAARLLMLAVQCQEQMLDLERQIWTSAEPSPEPRAGGAESIG